MAMPWRDTEMGFQRFYCLFWGFYLWILSGKSKLARAMLYVVENVFVWFCSFVNLQCNYRVWIFHHLFWEYSIAVSENRFFVFTVYLEEGIWSIVVLQVFSSLCLSPTESRSVLLAVHLLWRSTYMLMLSSFLFTLFRKPSIGIPTQTVARFSEVGSLECKPLFCFYISSLFACLM